MRAYSPDLRAKIVAAVDGGMNKAHAARTFGVGRETIRRYVQLQRQTGALNPRPHPGRPPTIRPAQQEALWAQLVEHPTAILAEHCELWEAQTGVRVSIATMSRAIRRLGWTRKKERWVPPSGTSSIERSGYRIVTKFDAHRYVFIDESGANITLVPRYGRAPKGERCPGIVPRNYGENLTLFASLTTEGVRSAMLLDGAADRAAFQLYVEHILVPTLKPGQVVILDNLSVHKNSAVRDAIHGAQCHVLFLPSYSPDFNPKVPGTGIEMAFSQIKAYLRRKAARTRETLEEEIGRAIDLVTPSDATAYFRHCGYVPL